MPFSAADETVMFSGCELNDTGFDVLPLSSPTAVTGNTQGCHTDTSCLWYCWRLDAAMICNSGLWPFFLSASAWLVCLTPCSLFLFVLLRHEQRVCAGLQPNEWTSPQRTQRSLMWSQVRLLFLLLCTNFYFYFFTLQQFSLSNEQVYELMAVFSWNIS